MIDKPKLEKRENNIYKNDEQDQKQKNLGQTTEVNPDPNKRPESRPESKMMNFFNQEFIERKIDFKPKKILSDHSLLKEEIKHTIKSSKIYDKLLEIEKNIDENMFKKRLEVQENLIMPSPKVKALLRLHIFGFFQQKTEDHLNSNESVFDGGQDENNWVLRIQGKIINYLDSQNGGFYRKFSFFFQKIVISFDRSNHEQYNDVEWVRQTGTSDIDGFEIKRKGNYPIKMKIIFYLNSYSQELKVSDELSAIIGLKQDTRPRIILALWQYIKVNNLIIKLNRLQDSENSKIILNNKELHAIFGVDKMDIASIPTKLNDHLKLPDPIEVSYTLESQDNTQEKNSLNDIIVTIDDPHYLDISNFLSNIDNESILFPKSLFYNKAENTQLKSDKNQQPFAEKFYNKLAEYDRNINDLIEKLKKHKYKYDFYEAYSKDPIKFINNFLIQQNFLLKIIKEESSIIDSRWDYQSAQYYKDYEDVLRDYTDNYLNKIKTQNSSSSHNN